MPILSDIIGDILDNSRSTPEGLYLLKEGKGRERRMEQFTASLIECLLSTRMGEYFFDESFGFREMGDVFRLPEDEEDVTGKCSKQLASNISQYFFRCTDIDVYCQYVDIPDQKLTHGIGRVVIHCKLAERYYFSRVFAMCDIL